MAELVACPFCKGEIDADALKCRHCGEWVKEKPVALGGGAPGKAICSACGCEMPAGGVCPGCGAGARGPTQVERELAEIKKQVRAQNPVFLKGCLWLVLAGIVGLSLYLLAVG